MKFLWLGEDLISAGREFHKLQALRRKNLNKLTFEKKTRPGLLKLGVAIPFGVAKCNFGVAKQSGLTNQIEKFL